MVQMNLFPGQKYRRRYRERTCGHGGGEEKDGMNWGDWIDMYTLPYIKQLSSIAGKLWSLQV